MPATPACEPARQQVHVQAALNPEKHVSQHAREGRHLQTARLAAWEGRHLQTARLAGGWQVAGWGDPGLWIWTHAGWVDLSGGSMRILVLPGIVARLIWIHMDPYLACVVAHRS